MTLTPNLFRTDHWEPKTFDHLFIVLFYLIKHYANLADLPFPQSFQIEDLALEQCDPVIAADEDIGGAPYGP